MSSHTAGKWQSQDSNQGLVGSKALFHYPLSLLALKPWPEGALQRPQAGAPCGSRMASSGRQGRVAGAPFPEGID